MRHIGRRLAARVVRRTGEARDRAHIFTCRSTGPMCWIGFISSWPRGIAALPSITDRRKQGADLQLWLPREARRRGSFRVHSQTLAGGTVAPWARRWERRRFASRPTLASGFRRSCWKVSIPSWRRHSISASAAATPRGSVTFVAASSGSQSTSGSSHRRGCPTCLYPALAPSPVLLITGSDDPHAHHATWNYCCSEFPTPVDFTLCKAPGTPTSAPVRRPSLPKFAVAILRRAPIQAADAEGRLTIHQGFPHAWIITFRI